jgi:hypothetical protein
MIGGWHALAANAILIVAGLHAAAALFASTTSCAMGCCGGCYRCLTAAPGRSCQWRLANRALCIEAQMSVPNTFRTISRWPTEVRSWGQERTLCGHRKPTYRKHQRDSTLLDDPGHALRSPLRVSFIDRPHSIR